MEFFHKGGGGSEAIQKFWDTFCAPTLLEFWAQKGGGVDQIQNFLGTFYPGFGEIWPKKVPQKFQKKISLQKSVPKVPKVWGGGQTFLEEFHNKAAFFLWEAP